MYRVEGEGEGRKQQTSAPPTLSLVMGKPKRKHESDSDGEVKPNIRDDPPAKARKWTGDEYQLLLKLVVEKGTSEAFKSVPGRTYNQTRLAWR